MRKYLVRIGIISTIIVFIFLIFYLNFGIKKEMSVIMNINNQKVLKEEYQMIISSYQSKVKSDYATDQVNKKDFWITEFNGETPLNKIIDLANKELIEKKILTEIAQSNDIDIDADYETLKETMIKENKIREDNNISGEVVYGLSFYTMDKFYQYVYYNLESKVREVLKNNYEISEKELKEIYEKNKHLYSYDTRVKVLIGEFNETKEMPSEIINYMRKEKNIDILKSEFPKVNFYELEMNSLDTQEGKSGVYKLRWEVASKMQKGEICKPFKIGDNVLVMRCIEKEKNGVKSFEDIKGILRSQIQDLNVENYIVEEIENAKVKFKISKLEKAALEILK